MPPRSRGSLCHPDVEMNAFRRTVLRQPANICYSLLIPADAVQLAAGAEARHLQERRLQRGAGQRGEAAPPLPAGHLHDAGGRAVALDAARLCHELRAQLAGVRRHLVADRALARRPGARAQREGGRRARPKPLRRRRRLAALRPRRVRLRLVLPLQRRDAAHHRLRLQAHHRGVPRGHLRHVPAEHLRRHDTGVHGGHRVRQAVAAQEADADAAVQPARRHLPAGRLPLPHVPRRRHAQVAHCRGARARPDHPQEGDEGGRAAAVLPAGAARGRRRRGGEDLLHLAHHHRAPHRQVVAALPPVRLGDAARALRDRRHSRRRDRVDGDDDAGALVVPAQRDPVGPPLRAAGDVQEGDGRVRGGLQPVQQHVRGGHATVQRQGARRAAAGARQDRVRAVAVGVARRAREGALRPAGAARLSRAAQRQRRLQQRGRAHRRHRDVTAGRRRPRVAHIARARPRRRRRQGEGLTTVRDCV
ncbi:uncharacterized protein LOC124589717 isoform X1 [Schistocerca americana]|uniref:uncharacterized protein LOC124589717 isoform X1 n=1 Tax=Schistocerca americana TaxID=7009 RepID=UPI001F4FC64D|nr:uncharacterized protein LOC124589717 isoform X1 [Schistocerca americana]